MLDWSAGSDGAGSRRQRRRTTPEGIQFGARTAPGRDARSRASGENGGRSPSAPTWTSTPGSARAGLTVSRRGRGRARRRAGSHLVPGVARSRTREETLQQGAGAGRRRGGRACRPSGRVRHRARRHRAQRHAGGQLAAPPR
jgi:hypothetical protein